MPYKSQHTHALEVYCWCSIVGFGILYSKGRNFQVEIKGSDRLFEIYTIAASVPAITVKERINGFYLTF